MMTEGAAQCGNGHLFCIRCVIASAAKDLGMTRDVKWSSSIHQALSWSGFRSLLLEYSHSTTEAIF